MDDANVQAVGGGDTGTVMGVLPDWTPGSPQEGEISQRRAGLERCSGCLGQAW